MKKFALLFSLMIAVVALISSCEKEEEPTPDYDFLKSQIVMMPKTWAQRVNAMQGGTGTGTKRTEEDMYNAARSMCIPGGKWDESVKIAWDGWKNQGIKSTYTFSEIKIYEPSDPESGEFLLHLRYVLTYSHTSYKKDYTIPVSVVFRGDKKDIINVNYWYLNNHAMTDD